MIRLCQFAEHEFRLGKRGKDGKTLRETLQVVERMTGHMPIEGVNPAEFPQEIEHLWGWFLQLNAKRPQAMNGISPIPESEMHYFFSNRQIQPQAWEVDAISAIDVVAITAAQEEQKNVP